MRLSFALVAIAASICLNSVHASPVVDAESRSVARSMLGASNNLVSWDSQPLERSPSDPDQPDDLSKRIVYNPPVTSPTRHTVWRAGRRETVTWQVNQEDIPANAKNYQTTIMLGYIPADGKGGYNLKWTLAKDIPITDEEAEVTLPADLKERNDYIIVVMGDSGNRSKKFTIRAAANHPKVTKTDGQSSCGASHPSVKKSDGKRAVDDSMQDTYAPHMLGRDVVAESA